MGDSTKIAKAKRELEELYSGIPDESVNLTFGDLAEVRQPNGHLRLEKKNSPPLNPIPEASPRTEEVAPLTKMPSLDFSRGLEASAQFHYQSKHLPHMHHHNHHSQAPDHDYNSPINNHLHHGHDAHYGHGKTPPHHHSISASPYNMPNSMVYDDMSQSGFPERGGRRRPGIPHSNICTVCSTYIYIFRHRCLVCGRVYCRQCVGIGMGEMAEGRKCVECLGRRFSQRYIGKAGQIGCCVGYPSIVKQQELKWAEKGARGTGDNRHGQSGMVSRPLSPVPRMPARRGGGGGGHPNNNNPPPTFVSNNNQSSFVMGSPYSPYYSPSNHPLPF